MVWDNHVEWDVLKTYAGKLMVQNDDKYYSIASLVSASDLGVEELWNEFLPFNFYPFFRLLNHENTGQILS